MRWQIGDVRVTAVLESADAFSHDFLTRVVIADATREALAAIPWLRPSWVDDDGGMRFVTQALLVESGGVRIVVDTCLGNDKVRANPALHRLQTPFLERLAAAGAAPEDVDVVLCTHMHLDHVGWNTRWTGERWVPTFPRARYLFARTEWEHWHAHAEHVRYLLDDSVAPLVDAGLVTLVGADHAVTDEVALTPTPGHTPGHVSVRIRSRGAEAVITGDMLHHPCQVARPHWTGPADSDQEAARATREAFLDDAEARGIVVIGTHFAAPAAGCVVADGGEGRRFAPVEVSAGS